MKVIENNFDLKLKKKKEKKKIFLRSFKMFFTKVILLKMKLFETADSKSVTSVKIGLNTKASDRKASVSYVTRIGRDFMVDFFFFFKYLLFLITQQQKCKTKL